MAADDQVAQALIEFLRREGATSLDHGLGRTLLDHLVETYAITRRWQQPRWLQHAALIHSVYGTDTFERPLLPPSRRDELRQLAGERAERLAHLFSVVPRDPLFAGTHTWAAPEGEATRDELDAVLLLHLANGAEQAQDRDGSPGVWLAKLRELAELLIDSESVSPPLFTAELATFSAADETLTRRAYRDGGEDRLSLAAAVCPVVPEPCVWLSHLARSKGDQAAAQSWAAAARKRLQTLGTAWDKRLSFEQWHQLAEADRALEIDGATDPRALYEAATRGLTVPGKPPRPGGRDRWDRYLDSLGEGLGKVYPGLDSQPWYDPQDFPLARYLELHAAEIRDEILAIDPSTFQRESERIGRRGDWDVAFFYERGRRHDELCQACPVTTAGIEAYPAVRTLAGLIYASRMRPGTHIQPHRGPTNLRVRCHLGIEVPEGDCAIRVGDETRRWEQDRCLVFDDFFEHEAWNHTGEDRIVLIVDMWHPGLSAEEVSRLERLHGYTHAHARKLNRYWAKNAAARAD